jgi:hypothetical protein
MYICVYINKVELINLGRRGFDPGPLQLVHAKPKASLHWFEHVYNVHILRNRIKILPPVQIN